MNGYAGNQVRINVQLIEAATGGHVWAERYDRELKDIFALQDDVCQKIVRALEVKLTAHEQGRVGLVPTGNLEAYDYFLRGVAQMWQVTKASNRQAQQLFEQALKLDPEYAAAAAFLGFNYYWEWFFWSLRPQTLEQALTLAQRAASLDDTLPEAHTILGVVYWFKKQHEQAIAEQERAIELNPNYADGYLFLGFILSTVEKPEEGLRFAEHALRLNPHPSFLYFSCLGLTYYVQQQYKEAERAFKRALALKPTNVMDHIFLANIAIESGRLPDARPEILEALRLSPIVSPRKIKQMLPLTDPAISDRFVNSLRKALATLRLSDYMSLVKFRVAQYFQERRTRAETLS